jgi:crossover junction endodeoxyribonuclease RusA
VAYKEEVQDIASECLAAPLEGCVSVRLELHPVMPQDAARRAKRDSRWGLSVRRIDLDNAQKVALDALQGIAYHNDRQITHLTIRLGAPVEGGGLTVHVGPDEFWESPV